MIAHVEHVLVRIARLDVTVQTNLMTSEFECMEFMMKSQVRTYLHARDILEDEQYKALVVAEPEIKNKINSKQYTTREILKLAWLLEQY